MLSASGLLYILTLTAPSHLGEHCMKFGCDRAPFCSHEICPCTPPGGIDLGEWNASMSKRWNRFLTLWEREYGERPDFFRAVEPQDGKHLENPLAGRGALHQHAPLRSSYVLDKKTIRRLAIAAGFGHELVLDQKDPRSIAEIRQVAVYVSKYVTKATDVRSDVPWAAPHTDPFTGETSLIDAPPTYRSWSQSRSWGTTMVEMRRLAAERYKRQEAVRTLAEQLVAQWNEQNAAEEPQPDG
jgi:hypothetical protein